MTQFDCNTGQSENQKGGSSQKLPACISFEMSTAAGANHASKLIHVLYNTECLNHTDWLQYSKEERHQ